ncbi:MAG: Gfo/Idh/MocA family oxidoreductase, partial [Chloroflexi bacterium]|nr:Gfo/Idh/MocA family oxidoreductase [Chloroflexota bacterium]
MAGERIGIGIVGANLNYGWGGQVHLPAIAGLPEYDFVAVCTTRRETAQATAGQFDIKRPYWDVAAMLQDPAVQVVDVCVRAPQHYGIVKAALEAGKHVYCEWPLGVNSAEAEELAALAISKGVHTMVGVQARGAPALQHLRALVAEGYVGKVLTATLTRFSPGILRPRAADSTWNAKRESGVTASLSTQVSEWPIEGGGTVPVTAPDTVMIAGRLTGGAAVSVTIATIPYHGSTSRFEVYGTEGTLAATTRNSFSNDPVTLLGARGTDAALAEIPIPADLRRVSSEIASTASTNVAQMLARLAEGINSGKPAGPDFTEAARRQRLLDSIFQAS